MLTSLEQERQQGIGGSDAGTVMGLSAFGCRRRLCYEKRDTPPDFPKDHRPEWDRGKYMEPVIRKLYQETTGRTVATADTAKHPEYEYLIAHLDGLIGPVNDDEKWGVFEAKTVNRFIWKRFQKEGIRDEYLLQMQHYLLVTGCQWGSFAILCLEPWSFCYFDVQRDDVLCAALLQEEVAFWGTVENGPIPEPLEDLKDRRCATCEFRRTCRGEELAAVTDSGGKGREEGAELVKRPELTPLLAEIQELGALKDEASEMYEEVRGKLKAEIGEAYGLIAGGFRALYPTSYPERWDTKALESLMRTAKAFVDAPEPVDYAEMEKQHEALTAFLSQFTKAKKQAKAERSLRIYATGD